MGFLKGLGPRLALNLAAAALVGLSIVDVAFVLWFSNRLSDARHTALYATALIILEHVDDADWFVKLESWAREDDVVISLRNDDGRLYSTGSVKLPATVPAQGWSMGQGVEHVAALLPARSGWQQLWVSRRADNVLPAIYAAQREVLKWLLLSGLSTLLAGMILMRRAVITPLEHLTDLIFAGDAAGIMRLGTDPREGLGGLGQAVIGLAHTVEEDRARIASQLEDLRTTHTALENAQKQLVRSERLAVVGKLSAGLAHEIGNPLAVMGGFVELVADETLPAEQRKQAVTHIADQLQRIQKTVRQLLDFSRAPQNAAHSGDVRNALITLQAMLAPQERWRGIRVLLPRIEAPVPVRLDTDALVQVLLNLFFNAADAQGNKGTFRVALRNLQGGAVALDVEDSGPGIPENIRGRIFEPFFTTKPAGVGTGMGLAVCENIINAAGGDISVGLSATLGGAHFVLTLPPALIAVNAPTPPA